MDYRLLGGIFLEGILSFLSPCVLPLIPLYMSYLAGENKQIDEEGKVRYHKSKVFLTTVFFVAGIAVTFVLLAASLNALGGFLNTYNEVISIIGGTLLIVFGLHETGLIRIDVLDKEYKPKIDLKLSEMSYFKAFLLGLVFSLGWSPCIGPLLANAIFLAAGNPQGYFYIIAYAAGLIIPFLLCGLFTSAILNFLQEKKDLFRKVMIIAGIVMIGFGAYMIYHAAGSIQQLKSLNNQLDSNEAVSNGTEDIGEYLNNYEFHDIDGKTIQLKDYRGKYVFLNFATTWCTYCVAEIPDYQAFAENDEVTCFYVMTPLQETGGMSDIEKFLAEKQLSLPVIIDEEGILFYYCGVNSFPTTYVIDPDGHFLVYANGQMSAEGFTSLLDYAKQLNENSAE